jgi:hypothetical protein
MIVDILAAMRRFKARGHIHISRQMLWQQERHNIGDERLKKVCCCCCHYCVVVVAKPLLVTDFVLVVHHQAGRRRSTAHQLVEQWPTTLYVCGREKQREKEREREKGREKH